MRRLSRALPSSLSPNRTCRSGWVCRRTRILGLTMTSKSSSGRPCAVEFGWPVVGAGDGAGGPGKKRSASER